VKVHVNGRTLELPATTTIADLVAQAGARTERGVAVALDGEVVPRSAWGETRVVEGQEIEVLEARQGG
jgi:sulfur carrier protein